MRIKLWQCAVIAAAVAAMGCSNTKEWSTYKPQWPWQKKDQPKPETGAPPVTSVKPTEAMAAFNEGLSLLAELQYAQAAVKFQSVVNPLDEAGDRKHASEAFFWLGYCCEKQGMTDKAKLLYQQLVKVYGDTPAADQARQHLTDIGGPAVAAPAAPATPKPSVPKETPVDLEARWPASAPAPVEVK